MNLTPSHLDTYIQRYSHLKKRGGPICSIHTAFSQWTSEIAHASTQFRMVKSGPVWFLHLFFKWLSLDVGTQINKMEVISTLFRNKHSLTVFSYSSKITIYCSSTNLLSFVLIHPVYFCQIQARQWDTLCCIPI